MRHYLQLALLGLAASACSAPDEQPDPPAEPTWFELREAGEEPPTLLSELGLYSDPAALEVTSYDGVVPYEPVWPLWSNGLGKSRFVVLPEETTVATGDDPWVFPDDTLFFKTFEDDDGAVETRAMWKSPEDGWQWYAYVWNDEGTDAERTEGRRSVDVEVTVAGESLTHNVPNELDCRTCHEPDDDGVLGFEPLQLGESVSDLDVFDAPPEPVSVRHDDPATQEILGWFVGNCTSCHNGTFEHDQSSFDLRPDVALENIIDRETESSASVDGIRIVPGVPEESVLYLAVAGASDDPELKLMPPVGVQRRDATAIARLEAWIEALE